MLLRLHGAVKSYCGSAIPDLYSAIAQSAAAKAASFANFLEEILCIDDIG